MPRSSSPKKDRIPLPVRESIYRMVHDYGPVALANRTGQSVAVIDNKANPNGETTPHLPTVADVMTWMNVTCDYRPLHAIAAACDHVAIPLPDLTGVSDAALLDHLSRVGKEGGDFHAALGRALRDRRLRASEVARIRREALEWIAAIHETVGRIEGMVDA